eukprot:433240_1
MEANRFLIISVNDAPNIMNGHDYNNSLNLSTPCHLSLPSLPPSVTTSASGISETSERNSSAAYSDFCALFDQTEMKTPEVTDKSDYHYKMKISPILLPKLSHSAPLRFEPMDPSTLSTTLSDTDCESLYEKSEISGGMTSCTESPSIITSMQSPSVITPSLSCAVTPSPQSNSIEFDIVSGQHSISSKGLQSGYHEWTIKVMDCDIFRQEIGVISNLAGCMDDCATLSISDNDKFGARAVYGCIMETKTFYYSSYNKDNSCRCKKDLSALSSWWKKDEIKVCLDLDKGTIVFMLNDKKVRKSISVQKNVVYYPIVSFCGECKYQVV